MSPMSKDDQPSYSDHMQDTYLTALVLKTRFAVVGIEGLKFTRARMNDMYSIVTVTNTIATAFLELIPNIAWTEMSLHISLMSLCSAPVRGCKRPERFVIMRMLTVGRIRSLAAGPSLRGSS